MNADAAINLISAFAKNQTLVTHQANSRRGVTKTAAKAEKKLSERLLRELIEYEPSDEVKAALAAKLNE